MSINYSLTAISANSNKNISDTTPFSITQNFTTNHLDLSRIKKWTLTKTADGWGVVNFILLKENSKISLHFNIRDTTTVIDYNDGGFRGGVFYNDIHNLPNPSSIFISFHVVDGWKIEYVVGGVNKEIKFENKLAISSVDEIMDTPVIVSTPSNMVSVSTPVILEKNISLSYSVPDNSYCTISSGIITPIGSSESVGNSVIVTATLSGEGISTSLTATHTINFLKTPAYIRDITRDEIFYSSIGSTYTPPLSSVPTESSFIPNLVSPNFKYSISYLSNQEYAEANVPVATISNDSSYLSNIVGTGMCYYTVTVPANEAEFLDTVVVTFHFLLVRPGYIIGPSADLTDAVIQNYDLSGVNFSNCNLTNAKIINCLLENANFTNAVFTNTIFTYNKITDSTKLTNATFNGLISSNNSGKTTQITSNYEIKGGRIVQEGTVFLSLTFYLESPEIIPDSGINTTTPYNGDGHYKVVNDGLAINGRIETAGKMETNLIIKTLNVRYQITQVGPGAKYMFEVIVARTYSQGIYFNQMYIRGINTTTNTITTLPNTLDQQTFAVAYKLDLPLPVGYVINGSYLFGPNMNLSGTYFDNTVNPKPDLSNLPSNLTLNNIVISSSSTLRGKQWTQPSIYTHAPIDVYVSSTGKVIAYVNGYQKDRGILYSKNYGASYNETSFATYRGWNTICGTATGDIIYVFANNIMTKNGTTIKTKLAYTRDKFATLTYINTPSASSFFGGNTTNYIEKLRCSSDGKLLIGTERGPVGSTDIRVPHIYRSSDYGNNWTDIVLSSLKGCATGLAMSKDGKYVYVTVDGTSFDTRPNTGTGGVWRSNDYGLTFTQVYFETKIYKVECNATGEIVIFSDSTTSSRISWNYGTNWTPLSAVNSDKIWSACISETGNSIWVGYYDSFGGNFSNSLDYGRTWTYSITPTGQWTWFGVNCLGCNSDASIVVSGGNRGLLGQYREYSTDNDTILEGWTLSGTSLQNGYFANVCFSNCNCNSTNFSGSNLENASFKITSSTSIATLQNAKLTNCQLDNLTITGYDLSMNMNVAGLDFDGSQIKYITTYFLNETGSGPVNMLSVSLGRDSNKYDYKMITDNSIGRFMAGPGMCLKELTLGNANFSDTNLSNIDILETNLASTSLNRVSMRQGNLFYSSSNTILPSGYRAVKQPVTFNTVNALQFNGTTNFVDFNANIVELGKSSFTIECWIKTNETEMGILNCQNNNTTWEYGEKSLYIDTNGIPVFVGYSCEYIYSTVAINDNKWHHIAVTWSYTGGTSGTGTFYIDGINKTNNDIQILKIPSVPMTENTSAGLIASASSFYDVNWLPWYAFDLNTNTGWHSNVTYNGNGTYQGSVTTTDVNRTVHSGEWLQLQLGTAVKLHTFYITPRDGLHLARSPTSFVVLGSNDGSAWNIVHEELNKSWTNQSETFIVSRPTSSYSYYRMVVKQTGIAQGAQPDSVQIMEWVLNRTSVSKYKKYIANTLNAGTFVFGKPNYFETKKFFKGAVCELRIWNVARSASEILQNYRRVLFGNEYGLVAYNRFNQGIAEGSNSGVITVTNNKTTGGYTGTLSGNFTLSGTVSNWVSGISMNTNTGYIVGKGFDLSGVDARGLNFELSDISAVNFTNALFSGVKSGNMKTNELTTLPNEYRILNGYFVGPFIDLSGANLSSSILTDSNLTGVNLTNALLYRAVSGGIRNTATVDGVQSLNYQPCHPDTG